VSERTRAYSPAWLRGNRNLVLFLSLMLTIVLLPAFERSRRGELLFTVVSMFIVFVAVVVNGRSRWRCQVAGRCGEKPAAPLGDRTEAYFFTKGLPPSCARP
jgi:hypothetical protein